MTYSRFLAPLAFASALLLSASIPGDALGFHPGEDASISKSFEVKVGLVLEDLMLSMNGEVTDPEMMGMPDEVSVSAGYSIEVTDAFQAVEDGRPTDFHRTFDTMSAWFETSDGESDEQENDDLAGKTVHFLWDEEEGAYTRSFAEGDEGDDEDLEMIAVDMDLRSLLPEIEVEDGDEWTVSGFPLLLVLMPGLDVEALFENSGTEFLEDVPEGISDAALTLLTSVEATCTYEGSADVDGAAIGTISFICSVDQSVDIDASSLLEDDEMGMQIDQFEVIFELEIEGEYLWNLEEGRFVSFASEGVGTVGLEVVMGIPDMMEIEGSGEFSIELAHEFSAEAN
jgi:hypothetical protein